ncbi:uncharacterized protein (TIGR00725 family) [Methanolinea mesophila]|uniref:TIGR00725 family protein n=1 Tax=Methanolinea mesophila TaxID=547055 RepID=UPI001AE212D7|nr:TIGR00725 family protein [Methanolinea mesophila]MBP1929864.1 uncharacterized protein (TIGR00725 family) [Methanolinea mesophila]
MSVQIGVIGPGDCSMEERRAAEKVGRQIARGGGILCCGGLSGVMEAASRGAKEEGGITVGIIPGTGGENDYLDVVIRTGLSHARNVVLVQSSDALVAVGGAYGTLSEIAVALKTEKPVFGVSTWEIPGVVQCNSPEEAANAALYAASRSGGCRSPRAR